MLYWSLEYLQEEEKQIEEEEVKCCHFGTGFFESCHVVRWMLFFFLILFLPYDAFINACKKNSKMRSRKIKKWLDSKLGRE